MASCPRCAAPNVDNAITCSNCRASLSDPSAVPGWSPQGQPGQPHPPFAGGFPPVAPFNGLAIAGFVCSFLCSLVGLVLSAVAYGQVKNSNGGQRGGGLALAGIIISIVGMFFGILSVLARH